MLQGVQRGGPFCIRKLWLLACLVACLVGACAVHAQGTFEDCCLAYNRPISPALLQCANSYTYQEVSESCNLPAVIFVLGHRKVCGDPQALWVQKGMKLLEASSKVSGKQCGSLWRLFRKPFRGTGFHHHKPKKPRTRASRIPSPSLVTLPRAARKKFPPGQQLT